MSDPDNIFIMAVRCSPEKAVRSAARLYTYNPYLLLLREISALVSTTTVHEDCTKARLPDTLSGTLIVLLRGSLEKILYRNWA